MSVSVGFIGLGNMGGRMTKAMRRSGVDVLGYDTLEGRAADVGATAATSIAHVVEARDVVLLSLPDSGVVERVVLGPGGVAEHIRPGQTVVDLSTSEPLSTVRIAKELAACGAQTVDAGISGGAAAAERGELTLMVGGERTVVDSLTDVFAPIASNVFYMGSVGSGHVAKLLNNFLNAISLASTAEVMVAAQKGGLDLATFLDVLNLSSGANFATEKRFPAIIRGDYLEGGLSSKLMIKDILLYIDYVAQQGVPSLAAAGALSAFGLATQLGYGDQISNRVVDAIGDMSGGVRLHPTNSEDLT